MNIDELKKEIDKLSLKYLEEIKEYAETLFEKKFIEMLRKRDEKRFKGKSTEEIHKIVKNEME
jgi:hypothetical protein